MVQPKASNLGIDLTGPCQIAVLDVSSYVKQFSTNGILADKRDIVARPLVSLWESTRVQKLFVNGVHQ